MPTTAPALAKKALHDARRLRPSAEVFRSAIYVPRCATKTQYCPPQSSPPQAITQSPVFTALHFRFMEPPANSSTADAVAPPVEVSDDDEDEEMAKIRSSELDRVVLPSGLQDHEYDALMESYEAEASGQAEMAKAFNLQSKLTH